VAIKKFDEIQEDVVFLLLKAGLPDEIEVVDAIINEKEKFAKGESRKDIVFVFRNKITKHVSRQSFNYKKIERTVTKGGPIEA